eukprot:414556-Pyramimonas_sp.AAC.1
MSNWEHTDPAYSQLTTRGSVTPLIKRYEGAELIAARVQQKVVIAVILSELLRDLRSGCFKPILRAITCRVNTSVQHEDLRKDKEGSLYLPCRLVHPLGGCALGWRASCCCFGGAAVDNLYIVFALQGTRALP